MAKLHARNVGKLEAPQEGRKRYWDAQQPGLFVRVTASGAKSYKVTYRRPNGRKVDFTIGSVEKVSLSDAREKAREILAAAQIAKPGEDPQAEKMKARIRPESFKALAERAMKAFVLRPSTRANWEGLLKNYIMPKLGHRDTPEIDRKAIRTFTENVALTSEIQAARSFEVVRRIFSWAVEEEILPGSPFVGLKKPVNVKKADAVKRTRTLKQAEIHKLFAALQEPRFRLNNFDAYVALLFETACRRDEILKAPWDDIHFASATFTIKADRNKSKRDHELPLTEKALTILKALKNRVAEKAEIESMKVHLLRAEGDERDLLADKLVSAEKRLKALLKSPWVFPSVDASQARQSPQRALEALRDHVAFDTTWSIHDVRRTTATGLNRLGTLPHVREAILGHALDALTETYVVPETESDKSEAARVDGDVNVPLLQQRAALEKWSKRLESFIATSPEVAEMKQRDAARA